MKVSGKNIKEMEKVKLHGQMDRSMKEIGVIISVKVKEQ